MANVKQQINIGVNCKLTLMDAKSFANHSIPVLMSHESYSAMQKSHDFLKSWVDKRIPIYGISTNFGDQVCYIDPYLKSEDPIPYYQSITARQKNIIKSLTCSLGDIISSDIIRITMLLRAHCLAQGYSGVAPIVVETIIAFLKAGVTPIVRRYGSIGASGDLIPLSTIAAGLIGENIDVHYQGGVLKAPEAIQKAGLKELIPELRDGLALINGTSFMSAIASLSLYKLKRLFPQMLSSIAMSLESLLVINSAFNPLVHQLKRQAGNMGVNEFFLNFWQGSQLVSDLDDVRQKYSRPVQDYYSLRSASQGFGPFQENLEIAIKWVENEMNSVNDNPIIDILEEKIHHNANFMGYHITNACDMLKMDIAQASTWIHALLANMMHSRKSHDLPTNLAHDPAINNGFRSMQLLSAALAVQNRKFGQVHQSYTLPTEGDNQDVNSLGTHAALDFQEAVANLERLTAILLMTSVQALEFRGIHKSSIQAQRISHIIREYSPRLVDCRPLSDELMAVVKLLEEEKI